MANVLELIFNEKIKTLGGKNGYRYLRKVYMDISPFSTKVFCHTVIRAEFTVIINLLISQSLVGYDLEFFGSILHDLHTYICICVQDIVQEY